MLHLFLDALDFPVCVEGDKTFPAHSQTRALLNHAMKAMRKPAPVKSLSRRGGRRLDVYNSNGIIDFPGNLSYNPCDESHIAVYLNLDDVQEAMHVKRSENVTWTQCHDGINSGWMQMDAFADVRSHYSLIYNHPKKPKDFKMLGGFR